VHEIISRYVESNLTGFQNLSGLVVELISGTFLRLNEGKKLMVKNKQGGDNIIDCAFYGLAITHIKDHEHILNLGCGSHLNFERNLLNKRNVTITSCDINPINTPYESEHLNFLIQDVEKLLTLDSKVDVVTFFELIEHIDKTDILLQNCYNNLRRGGVLICSVPNLASIYARIELLLGFQPHILEVSNVCSNFGTGVFGKLNNPNNEPIHHIRGFTLAAIKEMLKYYGFEITQIYGYDYRLKGIMKYFSSLAPVNIIVSRKISTEP